MAEPDRSAHDAAAERLHHEWRAGRQDLDRFLAGCGELGPAALAGVLRVDQRERWALGERVPAETYLRRYPQLCGDPEAVVDLIHAELLLRERLGEQLSPDEYPGRFPEYAETLRMQWELHRAFASTPDGTSRSAVETGSAGTTSASSPGVWTEVADGAGSSAARALPEAFGRYRILKLLGRGGMGAVYLAHDSQLDRPVALKVPRFDSNDKSVRDRFLREARIAATFHHPSLCPIYDVGAHEGIPYLTMPLLGGETMADWLRRVGRIREDEAARFIAQVARALEVAHRAGVIHRDLKPANIMVDELRRPIVMDFGLARSGTLRDASATAPGVMLGTPAYLPPEQIGGESGAMGPACDIYSLGVVLYEMLTGRVPFVGPAHAIAQQVLVKRPERPTRHRPDLDRRLESICLRALAKEPLQRFHSMGEFAARLEEWGERGPAPSSRRRLRVVALAVVAAGVCVLCGIILAAPDHWRVPRPASSSPDTLEPGSHWAGRFHFQNYSGDVEITVTARDGGRFRGVYWSEGGTFCWRIAGAIKSGKIRWDFTSAERDNPERDVVGRAHVEGEVIRDRMKVTFKQPGSGDAEMELSLTN
jgi:hypothetical protein